MVILCKILPVFIESLSLYNFKSYAEREFEFAKGINCIMGRNGAGKSNLLDAIYVLCLTKSGFGSLDCDLVRHGQEEFAVKGLINQQKVVLSYSEKGKKISMSQYDFPRLSDYIGTHPCVLVAPADQALVEEGSEIRRRFFDMAISQQDNLYLQSLARFNSYLKQRNALLKLSQESGRLDRDLLEAYSLPMAKCIEVITAKRKQFLEKFLPIFQSRHRHLAPSSTEAAISYLPDIEQEPLSALEKSLPADLKAARTLNGSHRDQYEFLLNDRPIKRFGSQGQVKSFVLSLKLALYELYPKALLLLDDIFDKLDQQRISALLDFLAQNEMAQFFITDARPERSEFLLAKTGLTVKALLIE